MTPRPLHQFFDAMYHGKYQFEDFLELEPKEHYTPVPLSGRTIYKPSKVLKEFHTFLNGFVLVHLPVNTTVSFAYRKGVSLLEAVTPHADSRAFYQTDIEHFFESINVKLIKSVLTKADTPVTDLNNFFDHILDLITIKGSLPIGYSTSPVLSNACLHGFDERLAYISYKNEWIYTRYADDIIISGADRKSIQNAQSEIKKCLLEELGEGFKLNLNKSKLTTVGRKVKILGLVILPNGDISIDRSVRDKIEARLFFYINDRKKLAKIFVEEKNDGMEDGLQRLSGLIGYVHTIDPLYLEKLRMKFGTTVIDSFLHRSAQ